MVHEGQTLVAVVHAAGAAGAAAHASITWKIAMDSLGMAQVRGMIDDLLAVTGMLLPEVWEHTVSEVRIERLSPPARRRRRQ